MKFDLDFYKSKAYRKVFEDFYQTMSMTLDTCDYVSESYDKKIKAFIFKDMRLKIRAINKQYALYQKEKKGPGLLDKLIHKLKSLFSKKNKKKV